MNKDLFNYNLEDTFVRLFTFERILEHLRFHENEKFLGYIYDWMKEGEKIFDEHYRDLKEK